ncbi:hypothetical protein JCM33374_g2634 [Metschnikowia sp. JCM 33374]|nr:hypothetical protein JCM33374_g2634 [Metschnikowia sp. JCM 33374]
MDPSEVEHVISLNIKAGRFRTNLDIAEKIKHDPLKTRFRTPELYALLLQSLAAEGDRNLVPLALELFRELAMTRCTLEDLSEVSQSLFRCFRNCCDFTQLVGLKIVFQSILARQVPIPSVAMAYLGAHMHVLLNSDQHTLALDHFRQCLVQMPREANRASLLRALPLKKLIHTLCMTHDCEALLEVLGEMETEDCLGEIDLSQWSEILGMALWKNHFQLVKIIYLNVIMEGISPQTLGDPVLEVGLTKNNRFLRSLSENTLLQILHTLSTHGDVSSCITLIEWHYMHKSMQGERALTKPLCLSIIRAYCYYHPEAGILAAHDDDDNSVKTVIDVIESFVSKRRHHYGYKDVVDSFSHKLHTYHAFDANVARAVNRETSVPLSPVNGPPDLLEDVPEDEILLKKKSNRNMHESAQGSVLKNTDILSDFVAEHFSYILEKSYSQATRQIFVNCVLAHLTTYQNTKAVVAAMHTMKSIDPTFATSSLDSASYDIMIQSFATSPAAMATGLTCFNHMKQAQIPVSAQNFKAFIFSSLRGSHFNQLLEFYAYEYLKSGPASVSANVIRRIRAFKRLNEEGTLLLKYLENYRSGEYERIDEIWDAYNFTKRDPQMPVLDEEYAWLSQADERDRRLLADILG